MTSLKPNVSHVQAILGVQKDLLNALTVTEAVSTEDVTEIEMMVNVKDGDLGKLLSKNKIW